MKMVLKMIWRRKEALNDNSKLDQSDAKIQGNKSISGMLNSYVVT